jgi:pimeloyl-ACP methyl ester carboxylesterase
MVDVGGIVLHITCEGERRPGQPLVVLEAGAGNSARTWDQVIGPIATSARACAYDRPGLGASGRSLKPQRAAETVDRLHALLAAAGERAPYVMAGHSYGGMIVRLYASRYPAEVAGLVLVDSSHEEQMKRFAALPPTVTKGPATPPIPEQFDIIGMSAELSKANWHADVPLVVLTRTNRPAPGAEDGDPRGGIWHELQRELATRSPQAEHIVATHSGHYIQNDEPALVIDAVKRVVAKASTR